jgi:triacylglycerol lipase
MTTFGTPHRGSAFADWAIRHLRVVSPFLPFPVSTLHELGSDGCAAFNAETPDDPCVRYFWVAAKSSGELPFPWTFTHSVVCSGDGENDGLVSVRSARWGESLGVWEGSHSNLINWPFSGPDRSRAWSEIAQRVSGG